jgi:hypothetical protein
VSSAGDDEGWRWVTYRHATHPSFWVATSTMPQFIGGVEGRPYQKDDGTVDGDTFKLRAEFDVSARSGAVVPVVVVHSGGRVGADLSVTCLTVVRSSTCRGTGRSR